MNCNRKGITGLIKVIANLHSQGFYIFTAFDDHSPIDLIAVDNNGKSYRLQVKYREIEKQKYVIHTSSVVNGKRVPIDKKLIDGWAVYFAQDDKVVYISKQQVGSRTVINLDRNENGRLTDWVIGHDC